MNKKVLYIILSLLGFAIAGGGCVMGEYGSPWTEFNAKGKVTERETGKPIEGIEISLMKTNYSDEDYPVSFAVTDSQGAYAMTTQSIFKEKQRLKFIAKDIDGEANGGYFAPVVVIVDIKADDFKGAKKWFEGRAEKTVDFVMVQTELPENYNQ